LWQASFLFAIQSAIVLNVVGLVVVAPILCLFIFSIIKISSLRGKLPGSCSSFRGLLSKLYRVRQIICSNRRKVFTGGRVDGGPGRDRSLSGIVIVLLLIHAEIN
jgi:hypothetical protein